MLALAQGLGNGLEDLLILASRLLVQLLNGANVVFEAAADMLPCLDALSEETSGLEEEEEKS